MQQYLIQSIYKIYLATLVGLCLIGCHENKARYAVRVKSGSFLNESIIINQILAKNEQKLIQKCINKHAKRNYTHSGNGFWYHIFENKNQENDSIFNKNDNYQYAQVGDTVTFVYDISDLNEKVIYTQKELDTITYKIDKEHLFFGLREGIKLLQKGQKAHFIFPSNQAYGVYGDEDRISSITPIQCNVKLLDLHRK